MLAMKPILLILAFFRRLPYSYRFGRAAFQLYNFVRLYPHRAAFGRFYEGLDDKRDIFYMAFSSNLLHWVKLTTSFIPDRVNLVLVGWDLSADEIEWVKANVNRPFHHIPLAIDDKTVWEFLFEFNRYNFGWVRRRPVCAESFALRRNGRY